MADMGEMDDYITALRLAYKYRGLPQYQSDLWCMVIEGLCSCVASLRDRAERGELDLDAGELQILETRLDDRLSQYTAAAEAERQRDLRKRRAARG